MTSGDSVVWCYGSVYFCIFSSSALRKYLASLIGGHAQGVTEYM